MGDITKEQAIEEIRQYTRPGSPPELAAMGIMRRVESWSEHKAVLAALDQILAEKS